jgi:hypothetical protein
VIYVENDEAKAKERLELYRFYINRPTSLMGCPMTYIISDSFLAEFYDADTANFDALIRAAYPGLSEIKTVRHKGWTYKGILMGVKDGDD